MTRRRARRVFRENAVVLSALFVGCRYVYDIWRQTGIRVGRVYVTLDRLMAEGHVVSGWDPGERPRRWYALRPLP